MGHTRRQLDFKVFVALCVGLGTFASVEAQRLT